jgi:hypothetical protein
MFDLVLWSVDILALQMIVRNSWELPFHFFPAEYRRWWWFLFHARRIYILVLMLPKENSSPTDMSLKRHIFLEQHGIILTDCKIHLQLDAFWVTFASDPGGLIFFRYGCQGLPSLFGSPSVPVSLNTALPSWCVWRLTSVVSLVQQLLVMLELILHFY